MWICKSCGQNNEDAASSCILCGGTDKESYVPAPDSKVVIPTAEERSRKKAETIDTSLRRPGTAASFTRTGSTGGSTSGYDTTLRPRGTVTGGSGSSSPRTAPTPPPTRPSGTSTPTIRPSFFTRVKDFFEYHWWILPLAFVVIMAIAFYPLGEYFDEERMHFFVVLDVALMIISVLHFIWKCCYFDGYARVIGLVYGILCSFVLINVFASTTQMDFERVGKQFVLLCGLLFVALFIQKLRGAIMGFRSDRPGLAITNIIFCASDFFMGLAILALGLTISGW